MKTRVGYTTFEDLENRLDYAVQTGEIDEYEAREIYYEELENQRMQECYEMHERGYYDDDY